MDMDIFRLSALGVVAALCALVLRRREPALATLLIIGTGFLLLRAGADALASVRGFADSLAQTAKLETAVWKPVWQTVGIGLVTRLSSAVCKDAGEGGVAAFLETVGAALALLAALPLAQALLDALGALL